MAMVGASDGDCSAVASLDGRLTALEACLGCAPTRLTPTRFSRKSVRAPSASQSSLTKRVALLEAVVASLAGPAPVADFLRKLDYVADVVQHSQADADFDALPPDAEADILNASQLDLAEFLRQLSELSALESVIDSPVFQDSMQHEVVVDPCLTALSDQKVHVTALRKELYQMMDLYNSFVNDVSQTFIRIHDHVDELEKKSSRKPPRDD